MNLLTAKSYKLKASPGIASLPAILMLGAIIIEVAIASVFLLGYVNNSIYGTRLSNQAFVAARAGIYDGVSRIILNKDLSNLTYPISISGANVIVSICKEIFFSCDGSETVESGKHQIVATGYALTRQHRVIAILTVDSVTGLVTIESIKDQP